MLEDFDKHVSVLSESFARMLSRRKMVGTTVKGLFAAVALATAGQLAGVGDAASAAHHCTCDDNWTEGVHCEYFGHKCPTHGCPTGCVTCYKPDCQGYCIWSTGQWVSCTGLGKCGKGYKMCRDCKCRHCRHACSCLSATICANCCTAQDVKDEMARLAAMTFA